MRISVLAIILLSNGLIGCRHEDTGKALTVVVYGGSWQVGEIEQCDEISYQVAPGLDIKESALVCGMPWLFYLEVAQGGNPLLDKGKQFTVKFKPGTQAVREVRADMARFHYDLANKMFDAAKYRVKVARSVAVEPVLSWDCKRALENIECNW